MGVPFLLRGDFLESRHVGMYLVLVLCELLIDLWEVGLLVRKRSPDFAN